MIRFLLTVGITISMILGAARAKQAKDDGRAK